MRPMQARLRALVELIDAPAVCTLMGLGGLPGTHPNFVSMPGMHGSYAANMGVTETDALIALGVRFDDRVTGRLNCLRAARESNSCRYRPGGDRQNRTPEIPIVGDVKRVLKKLTVALKTAGELRGKNATSRAAWWGQIKEWQREHPYQAETSVDEIKPQHLMAEIDRLSGGEALSSKGDVGQHQMWGAQFIRFNRPAVDQLGRPPGPWDSDCRRPSARSSRVPTNWSSRLSATAD